MNRIRSSSRTLVREWGFLRATIAGTSYSPSAVHALIEIDEKGQSTAASLVELLGLEKSSVSRLVGKLVAAGELMEVAGDLDGRIKRLRLTSRGRRTVASIHAYGQAQVEAALGRLSATQRRVVATGLADYADALTAQRRNLPGAASATDVVQVVAGYRPGAIGRIAEMHAAYYARHHGFGQFFESKVAAGVAEFAAWLDHETNQLWLAIKDERIVGSIAIDGQDLGEDQAHLRWFILDDVARGTGVGQRLLEQAIAFCDEANFKSTHLWTFAGLDRARSIYEKHGFTLAKEWKGNQWGVELVEQQFTRPRDCRDRGRGSGDASG